MAIKNPTLLKMLPRGAVKRLSEKHKVSSTTIADVLEHRIKGRPEVVEDAYQITKQYLDKLKIIELKYQNREL